MKRNCSLEEISDGRLYDINDMVKADCLDCVGCSKCCTGMGNSIVLDPLDIVRMKSAVAGDFGVLMSSSYIELNVVDGIILPNLKMNSRNEKCGFLSDEGRCSIHDFRPGICRIFPLGRYYENGKHRYFLQVNECINKNRAKIKVSKWIDTPGFKEYEKYIDDWHFFLVKIQEKLEDADDSFIKDTSMYILNDFYILPFEDGFYSGFEERLCKAEKELLR